MALFDAMTRSTTSFFLIFGLIAGLAVWRCFDNFEPSYQGRTLSAWLKIARGEGTSNTVKPADAKVAIKAIGTNAIPWLLRWIEDEKPPARRPVIVVVRSYLSSLHQRSSEEYYRWDMYKRTDDARYAFSVLGPRAVAAIPELRRIMNSTNSIRASANAAAALACIDSHEK